MRKMIFTCLVFFGCGEFEPDPTYTERAEEALEASSTYLVREAGDVPFAYEWANVLASTRKNCPAKILRDPDGSEALTYWSAANSRQVIWNAKSKKARFFRRAVITTVTVNGPAPQASYAMPGQKYLNAAARANLVKALKLEMKGKINVCN